MRPAPSMVVRALVASGALALVSCSSDGGAEPATTDGPVAATIATECPSGDPALLVDQITDAVQAVEDELGSPQVYFEVNATIVEVTVIVADPAVGTATPFRYRDGTLVAGDALEGSGLTFRADQLTFDPTRVTSCVVQQLPTSTIGMFYVLATEAGGVRRAVLVTSSAGGRLEAEVGDDGTIVGVDPLDDGAAAAAASVTTP